MEEGTAPKRLGFKPPAGKPVLSKVVVENLTKEPASAVGARFSATARKVTSATPAPVTIMAPAPKPAPVTIMASVPKKLELPIPVPAPAKKAVRFAEEEMPAVASPLPRMQAVASSLPGMPAIGGAGTAPAPAAFTPAAFVTTEADIDKSSLLSEKEVTRIKARVKGVDVRGIVPPPADSPMMDAIPAASASLLKAYKAANPVEVAIATVEIKGGKDNKETLAAGSVYSPITSPEFPYFMIQTYQKYSKQLTSLTKGADGKTVVAPKEIDKEACKKFDPNKVENFYYQKLVRDYLSFGTPYRGSLLYHGLGTGKTCTSIAAAEALHWGGQKKIFVLTPATLSNNYRRELAKCGYYPLRKANNWAFMPVTVIRDTAGRLMRDLAYIYLTDALGLPAELVEAQAGGWVADPNKPSNWESLTPEQQTSIREQQRVHLGARFRFIHYNGVAPAKIAQLAEIGLQTGTSEFDNAVIIIDEVHNLVRTINGTRIGGHSPATLMDSGIEPHEYTWSMPLRRERPGYKYPRGYTLYRLLQNAVNAKVICLSATPMINYAQELAILVNLIGGEQRTVEIPLRGLRTALTADEIATLTADNEASKERSVAIAAAETKRTGKDVKPVPPALLPPNITSAVSLWAKNHPEIDFFAIEEAVDGTLVLRVTPVPHGFMKISAPDYPMRGFVRMTLKHIPPVARSRERNMDLWATSLLHEMEDRGFFTGNGGAAEAGAAVAAARSAGIGTVPATTAFRCVTYPMLPDDGDVFVPSFVDRATLTLKNRTTLIARCSGLVSYFRGGSEELMPRTSRNEVVKVPMSDYMFTKYTLARMKELEMEGGVEEVEVSGAPKKRKGMTAAEQDLYAQATKTPSAGFKTLTRAACNWVFPEEIPRPAFTKEEQAKVLGLDKKEQLIAADLAEETDVEQAPATGGAGTEEPSTTAILADEPVAAEEPVLDAGLASKVTSLLAGLEAKADPYLNKELATFSPKYAAILANIRTSPGPVLVYSQFKTLEGLGIFAAALRAAPEGYIPLDIVQGADGEWSIPDALMAADRPRYILYTGDQPLEKRRLLLQLYNADVAGLPPTLSAQCAALLAGAPDNRDGRIARIFMITQSGAEGISLFNTRQVHVMEPYWNNVRLQQVIGRAIRTCSHMNLPWEEREVSVFTYLSVFSDTQKAGKDAKTLMMIDKGMTTDEVIYDIATKKQALADRLSEVLQEAAVDCDLHRYENGITGQCYRFGKGSRPNFLWHPDWKRDLQLSSIVRKA
jgi:hypothetical protein